MTFIRFAFYDSLGEILIKKIVSKMGVRPIYQISMPSIATPTHCFRVYSYWILTVRVSLLRALIFGIWALYITCDSISYSVIIFEIVIILFILSLLPNISYSVIKLPIIIIPDCTITDHTITDWSYYFLVLIPKVLLPILTITFCSYPELCYYR